MWSVRWWVALAIAGCGSVKQEAIDAPVADAAEPDAMLDAPGCVPEVLLAGGSDVGPQGWQVVMQPPATLSYGPDYVRLQTTSAMSAGMGGQLLLAYPGAVDAGQPFRLRIVLLVEAVNPHNPLDSGAAILGSFTAPFALDQERHEMIYLDAAGLGWADDSQRFGATILDGAYHTYELSVDAAGVARVSFDGTPAVMRTGYTSNGELALGDQTNDPGVDSALRIRSVTRLCP